MNPTNLQPSEGVGELRKEIRKCFTDTEMQRDDELTLFDTDQTIENIEHLITRRIQAFVSKVEEVVIGENEQFGPVPYIADEVVQNKPVRNEMRIRQRQALSRLLQEEAGRK